MTINPSKDHTQDALKNRNGSVTPSSQKSSGSRVPSKPVIAPKPGVNKNSGRPFLVRHQNTRTQKGDDALHHKLPSSDDSDMEFEVASASNSPRGGGGRKKGPTPKS